MSSPTSRANVLAGSSRPLSKTAGRPDRWITILAKLGLFWAGGVGAALHVRTRQGSVTIYGKVGSNVERAGAEAVVRGVAGVRDVWSLVRVVPRGRRSMVDASDAAIRKSVVALFRCDRRLGGIRVASVDDGVVLLAGNARSERQKLMALDAARGCQGVREAASLIEIMAD